MRLHLFCSVSLIGLGLALPALAADLPFEGKVASVTVYADAALVTRKGSVTVPAGQHRILLSNLPQSVDPDSIRIAGEGLGQLTILSIDSRLVVGDAQSVDETATQRRKLVADLDALRGRHEAATAQKSSMLKFAQGLPHQLAGEKSALPIADWDKAWQAIGGGIERINASLLSLNTAIAAKQAEIEALDNAASASPDGTPRREIIVNVEAANAASGALDIGYTLGGASWRPVYEAQLDTRAAKPSVKLTRRARVTQATGEDWNGVQLTLSTVSLNRGNAAPRLLAQALNFQSFEQQQARERGVVMDMETLAAAPAPAAKKDAEPAKPTLVRPQQAQVDLGQYQANFVIPGTVDLSMTGEEKAVLIDERPFEAELLARVVPAFDPTAYLEARFQAANGEVLLPGPMVLRRDGEFIGRADLPLVAGGDDVAVGFGADDLVKVTRTPLRRQDNDPSPSGTRVEREETRTSFKNLHTTPVKLIVEDRLPVSENTAIQVEALPTNTAATEKNADGRRGVMRWAIDLDAGKSAEIRFGYRVRSPADRSVAGFEVDR
jgi:uncharacterized protein (TIGR02231 family)